MKTCTIIVLNWNGRELLEESLPSIVSAIPVYQQSIEVLVVDNGSIDGSVDFVKLHFPSIKLLQLEKNFGFGEGNNFGVRLAKGEIIVLLNNDMVVERDFLKYLLEPFEHDDKIFAVGSQIFFQNESKTREETGKTFAYWDRGYIWFAHRNVSLLDEERTMIPIFWASAGAAAYHREKFLELSGFRSIYNPAYFEDADISYRAWKRGWKVVYAPQSIVYHKHRASSNKRFTPTDLDILFKRNQLLFLWSNVASLGMLLEHCIMLLPRLLRDRYREKNSNYWNAFAHALALLLTAVRQNLRERSFSKKSDSEFLKSYRWKNFFLSEQKKLRILFVCPYVPSLGYHAGGVRMYQIIKNLSARHEVSLLTYIEKKEESEHLDDFKQCCKKVISIIRGQSLDEPDWFHIKPHEIVKDFANPEMKGALERELFLNDYDIVQFEYLQMAYLINIVKKYNTASVFTEIEVQSRKIWRDMLHAPFLEKLDYFYRWMVMLNFENSICSRFDAVVALTKEDRKYIQQYNPKLDVRTSPMGIDTSFFLPHSIQAEPRSLLFVGYFRHPPNVDAMLHFSKDILPLIRKKYPDVKLYIVGGEIPREIQQLSSDNNVVVTGWVDDLRPYYEKATIFIAPIRLGAGMRGKILEAWAMKKPIVSSSVATEGYRFENGREILIADGPTMFADAVIQLLSNECLREKIAENGYLRAHSEYAWSNIAQQYEELYYHLFKS